jgi:hypothetical protein
MNGPVVTRVKNKKSLDPDAAALAAGTDELNLKLAAAEEVLRELGLGVEADVTIMSDLEDQADHNFYSISLCFRKVGGSWSLGLVAVMEGEEQGGLTPITSASREQRIAAASKLGDLLEAMRIQVRAERQRVDEANSAVDAFLKLARGT